MRASGNARTAAANLPRLVLEARRIAATVIHGSHGRRRAGSGENFWQFRRFVSGEEARRVDWRRSARDEHLYVREQEWEAAHTVWIWPDRSPSMAFASSLARASKLDRTLVMAFALAQVLVEAGERVGIPGLVRPTGTEPLSTAWSMPSSTIRPSVRACRAHSHRRRCRRSCCCPISGVRSTTFARRSTQLSTTGAQGHLVQIVDPVEETFPFSGRVEFWEPEGLSRDHGRPCGELARRLRSARGAASRRDPRRGRQARLDVHHSPHRPSGE